VLHVVIFVPLEFADGVKSGVLRYRGRFDSSARCDAVPEIAIHARVPQAEVGPFVSALMAYTNGSARTSMRLCEYWPAPHRPPADPTIAVREPRPNAPVSRNGAIAIPEPDEDFG
jgi:translation elongation factor EF-G